MGQVMFSISKHHHIRGEGWLVIFAPFDELDRARTTYILRALSPKETLRL